jgi:hypothetical protein
MNKTLLIQLFKTAVCALLLFISITWGQAAPFVQPTQSTATTPVLPLIETYKAPPYPKTSFLEGETYYYRKKSGEPLPPTLTDTLVCDVWQRVTIDLKLTIAPKEASEKTILSAFDVYLQRKWDDIAGYRPWTHWNFIRGLKESQRNALAKEIVAYINQNGVRDVER